MRITSGGQTGADRAALDAALASGLDTGGFIPLGRMAEDGSISDAYPGLVEASSPDPAVRTRLNVASSDATLIFSHGALFGGSALTEQTARELGKPVLHVDLKTLTDDLAVTEIGSWIGAQSLSTLNVAGPRASEDAALYERVLHILLDTFKTR